MPIGCGVAGSLAHRCGNDTVDQLRNSGGVSRIDEQRVVGEGLAKDGDFAGEDPDAGGEGLQRSGPKAFVLGQVDEGLGVRVQRAQGGVADRAQRHGGTAQPAPDRPGYVRSVGEVSANANQPHTCFGSLAPGSLSWLLLVRLAVGTAVSVQDHVDLGVETDKFGETSLVAWSTDQ
ncbi:MAG: hypothetical protein M3460_07630 [Actinomycetota bacterium]|nr:hypothetical protein [Actinomycetota bacterium]